MVSNRFFTDALHLTGNAALRKDTNDAEKTASKDLRETKTFQVILKEDVSRTGT